MNLYYERKNGRIYELCQTRFRDNPNHSWNVCAVATTHAELVEMYEKFFTGGVDWLEEETIHD